jgi:hypothetical protein
MAESKAWRATIITCVIAICLTAVICCWLLRPYRYEPFMNQSPGGGMWIFDRQLGDFIFPQPRGTPKTPDAARDKEADSI